MIQFATDGRPMPAPWAIAEPFFEAAARGELSLQRCPRHGIFSYPRTRCPVCLGDDWSWVTLSGRGTIYSYTVDRVGHDPAQAGHVPLAIAIVELEEGGRLVANVVDCEPEALRVGLPVEAAFETLEAAEGDATMTLVRFRLRA